MATDTELRAGDVCPIDGGAFVVDYEQDPETQIASKNLNSPNPAAAQRYERQVRAKVEAGGVIHKCVTCGYRARFKTAEADDKARAAEDTAREGREQARDARDEKAREAAERRGTNEASDDPADTTTSNRGAPGRGGATSRVRSSGNA
jgi:membrane protein involved in colicin uptake